MIIPILILVSSILFISGFLKLNIFNYTSKFLLHIKKPFSSSSTSPQQPSSSPKENHTSSKIIKDDDLKRVFDTFDKNGDGFVTKEELKESLNNMGMIVALKDVEEMVTNLDSNKDGLVDLGEFRELYELIKGKEVKNNEGGDKVGDFDYDDEDDLKEAFSVFDENKDG